MVMDMIRAGDVKEDNEEYASTLDELFERLERKNPEHIAVRYYKGYHSGSGKTLKSIQITLISHLEKFNLTSLAGITQTDEMELGEIGERKTAVFAVIPDSDSSYNFIVGMLYTQLFQQLYRKADFEHGGRLPVHVHFVMDEFANVALPDDFDKLLATMKNIIHNIIHPTHRTSKRLPMPENVRKGFRRYSCAVFTGAMILRLTMPAYAANDPLTVVNNLSTLSSCPTINTSQDISCLAHLSAVLHILSGESADLGGMPCGDRGTGVRIRDRVCSGGTAATGDGLSRFRSALPEHR